MSPHDLLNRYCRTHLYGIEQSTRDQLRYTLNGFFRFCGSCGLHFFESGTVNAWIDHLRSSRAHETVRTQRGNLLTIWHWAYEEGIVDEAPRRIRRLRKAHRSPEAWTVEEVARVIAAAAESPEPLWMSSLVRTGYDTALRLGDLLRLRPDELNGCQIATTANKTKRPLVRQIRPETQRAIERHLEDQQPVERIWPLRGCRDTFFADFRRVCERAGLNGSFRFLRRSAVTACENVREGSGTRLADHTSRSTTQRWYIDPSQLQLPDLPPLPDPDEEPDIIPFREVQ